MDLYNEIRKYESLIYKKNPTKNKDAKSDYKRKTEKKKQCKTCENLNKGARYYPEEACWFKTKEGEKDKIRKINNNPIIKVELNDEKKTRNHTIN